VDVSDARHIEIVLLQIRRNRSDGKSRKTELCQHRLELRAIGVRDDERTGAELAPAGFELGLGGRHLHAGILEAELRQQIVAGVLDDDGRARTGDTACGADGTSDR
jgi:hypothetical protein